MSQRGWFEFLFFDSFRRLHDVLIRNVPGTVTAQIEEIFTVNAVKQEVFELSASPLETFGLAVVVDERYTATATTQQSYTVEVQELPI